METLFDPSHYTLTPYALAPLVVGILTAALGIAVIIRERCSFVSVTFCLLTGTGAFWLLSYIGIYSAHNEALAVSWIRTENLAVVFIPSMATIFSLAVIQQFRRLQALAWASLACSGLFATTVLWGNQFIAGAYLYPWGYYARYGLLSIPFFAFFFGLMVANLSLFWIEYRRAGSGMHKQRLWELLRAFGVAYLGSIDFFAACGIPVYPAGYLPVFIFLVLGARAIWHYRLVDLTPAFAANQIVRTMADALLVLDLEDVVRVVNEAACRLFGRPQQELVGKPLWTISGSFFTKEKLDKLIRTGTIQGYETTLIDKDGRSLVLDVSASLIRDRAEEPVGVVCIARNISERKLADEQLRQAHEELQKSLEALKNTQSQLTQSSRLRKM